MSQFFGRVMWLTTGVAGVTLINAQGYLTDVSRRVLGLFGGSGTDHSLNNKVCLPASARPHLLCDLLNGLDELAAFFLLSSLATVSHSQSQLSAFYLLYCVLLFRCRWTR